MSETCQTDGCNGDPIADWGICVYCYENHVNEMLEEMELNKDEA